MAFPNPFMNGSAGRAPVMAIAALNNMRFGGAASTQELPTNAWQQGQGLGPMPFGQGTVNSFLSGFNGSIPQLSGAGIPTGSFFMPVFFQPQSQAASGFSGFF